MATIETKILTDHLDTVKTIPTDLTKWKDGFVSLTGLDHTKNPPTLDIRTYRVLRLTNLNTNLFGLLHEHIAQRTGEPMLDQTLIVAQNSTNAYYVLNSSTKLNGGTGTCDLLLNYM